MTISRRAARGEEAESSCSFGLGIVLEPLGEPTRRRPPRCRPPPPRLSLCAEGRKRASGEMGQTLDRWLRREGRGQRKRKRKRGGGKGGRRWMDDAQRELQFPNEHRVS